jgi:hypothetical protein
MVRLGGYGMREPIEDALVGAVCTIELDYARAQADCPYLQGMAPEEVCVNYVAEVALKMLPEDLSGLMGKIGSIEMYFDRNERFMRTIIGLWQRHRKEPGALKLIDNIEQVKDDSPVGIQAADFLAWHTNRDWWKRDGGEKDLLLRFRMIAAGLLTAHRYDYEKLMERYNDWPARGPDGRVLLEPAGLRRSSRLTSRNPGEPVNDRPFTLLLGSTRVENLPIMPGCSMERGDVRRDSRDFAVRGSSCAHALSSPLR